MILNCFGACAQIQFTATTTLRDPAEKLVPSSSFYAVLLALLLMRIERLRLLPYRLRFMLDSSEHVVLSEPALHHQWMWCRPIWVQVVLRHVCHDVQTEFSTLLCVGHPVVGEGVVHSVQSSPQPWVWWWYTRNVHHFFLLALVWRLVHDTLSLSENCTRFLETYLKP